MAPGAALALILDELGRAGAHGYDVAHMAINNNFRVPQQRERLYFVGFSTLYCSHMCVVCFCELCRDAVAAVIAFVCVGEGLC